LNVINFNIILTIMSFNFDNTDVLNQKNQFCLSSELFTTLQGRESGAVNDRKRCKMAKTSVFRHPFTSAVIRRKQEGKRWPSPGEKTACKMG
jgi:hypothetical protein